MRFSWSWWRPASKRWGGTRNQRSRQYQTAGFTYHQHLNVWECPAGQYLKLWAFDSQRRIAQYRAEAKACNSCVLKKNCTDSEDGRKLEHHLDSWLQSEVRRFHQWNFAGAAFPGGTDSLGRNNTPEWRYRFGRASWCHGAGRHSGDTFTIRKWRSVPSRSRGRLTLIRHVRHSRTGLYTLLLPGSMAMIGH